VPLCLELQIANNAVELARSAEQLRQFLEQEGASARCRYAVDLVMEEMVGNVIRYAWEDDGEHFVRVSLDLEADRLVMIIEDDGSAFDPTRHREEPAPGSLEEARIGGLGIQMVRRVVEEMRYEYLEGRNRLRLSIPVGRASTRRSSA
jgi:serine/threonine-protein kinase RsbW